MQGRYTYPGVFLAVAGLLAPSAGAIPPAVEVAPLVASADAHAELARTVTALIAEAGRDGHFAALDVDPELIPAQCALDAPERDRCFSDAASAADVANLVYVIAEPASGGARLACIGGDAARAQQVEIRLADAQGTSSQARLRQRSALAGCIIGALHAPPRI